jgi:DNA-binding GntR family transcriptional regulator
MIDCRLLAVHMSPTSEAPAVPLRQQLASALQREILTGVYAPGQRLIERELVSRFGVSSIPVREALQDLESQGLVVKRPNIGCSVVDLTREEAFQICRLRGILEPQVVAWAAENYTSQADELLSARVADIVDAAAGRDIAAFFHADIHFHRALWAVSGNKWASQALENSVGSLFAVGLMAARRSGTLDLQSEAGKHIQLLELIRKGQAQAAAGQMADIARRFESEILPGIRSESD